MKTEATCVVTLPGGEIIHGNRCIVVGVLECRLVVGLVGPGPVRFVDRSVSIVGNHSTGNRSGDDHRWTFGNDGENWHRSEDIGKFSGS